MLRNEVHFVTQVTGIVCARAVKEGFTHSRLVLADIGSARTIARSFQPESAALPIEVD